MAPRRFLGAVILLSYAVPPMSIGADARRHSGVIQEDFGPGFADAGETSSAEKSVRLAPSSVLDYLAVPGDIVEKTTKATKEIVAKTTLILGLHPWTMAFISSCIGSALTVIGFILQKKGAQCPGEHLRIGDVVLSQTWIAGFVCVVVADFPLSMFVYSFAPISLISPLSGITIILNLVVAPYLLSERVYWWPDLPATLLITVGIIVTTYIGAHPEPEYDAARLWGRFMDPTFLFIMLVTGLLVSVCIYTMQQMRTELERKAKMEKTKVFEMLLPAFAAAGAGLFSNIHLKAAGILLGSGVVKPTVPWFILTMLPAAIQINYLNRGMQLYPQAVFIPIYCACLMLMVTLGGAVFYEDYSYMQQHQMSWFFTGVLAVGLGIGLFAFRASQPLQQ